MKSFTILLLAFCIKATAQTSNPRLTLNPAKPEAGKTLTYSYDLSATPLDGKTVSAEIMQLKEFGMAATDLTVSQKGNIITGTVAVKKDARALLLNFYAEERDKEINEPALTPLYDNKGQQLALCSALMATVLSGEAYVPAGIIKTDMIKAITYFEDELNTNPASRKRYLVPYIELKLKAGQLEDREKMIREMEAFTSSEEKPGPYRLRQLKTIYQKLNSAENVDKIEAMLKADSAESAGGIDEVFDEKFEAENDPAKALKLLEAYKAAKRKKMHGYTPLTSYYGGVLSKAIDAGNWQLFNQVAGRLEKSKESTDKILLTVFLNSAGRRLAGQQPEAEPPDLQRGLALSKKSLTLINTMLATVVNEDESYLTTPRRYKKRLEWYYNKYADTYAMLLYKKGQFAEALKYQQAAIKTNPNAEMKERLLIYTAKLKGKAAITAMAEEITREGNATEKIITMLRENWIAKNGAAGWDAYIAGLQKGYKLKLKGEWAAKIENYAAPRFTIKDLEGKDVSLESLAGKVVVVDFWATWCGPCKASFPGMQKAQAIYKDDPHVKFVFVDTWENLKQDETDKKVNEFISKNKYPFHVLMDYDNQVVEKFEVSGIPTKFIIDQKGNVRFKAVGFSGTDQKVVDEITTMIDILKEGL